MGEKAREEEKRRKKKHREKQQQTTTVEKQQNKMAYNTWTHHLVFHGGCVLMVTLTQGFWLGYLVTTSKDFYQDEKLYQVCVSSFI